MTKTIKDSLWDDSLDQVLKLAQQVKAKEAGSKRKEALKYRNFLRKSDWVLIEDWKPPKKLSKRIRSSKRGV
jgi:hypothetical protein